MDPQKFDYNQDYNYNFGNNPGIVLMMVVCSSSPRQRKPVWMSMSLKRLSATVLMMLPKSRILKEALSGFVISCNASYHPRFCTIILGEKLFRFVN